MGQLVLAIFPRMRGEDNRQAKPIGLATCGDQLPREDQILAQSAKHFRGEGFVGDCQIETALVSQNGAYDGFFVKGCYHATGLGFRHPGLGGGHTMLQQI